MLGLVFLLGALTGGAGGFALAHRRHASMLREERREGYRLRALTRTLDLDADQQQKVGAILAKDRDEARALGREVMERCGQPLRDHKARVEGEIRSVLRPEQQRRFDALVEERREHLVLPR